MISGVPDLDKPLVKIDDLRVVWCRGDDGTMSLKDLLGFGKKKDRAFVNRAPRVRVNYLHDLEFNSIAFKSPLKIENISSSGMGLILPPDTDFASLVKIEGNLRFETSNHHLILKVVRFNGDHVGVSIESPSGEFVQALNQYFESEMSALQLRATSKDILKSVASGIPHWFQGSNNCDLSYVSNGSEVVEFALSVFGNHLEGGVGKPLRYSAISEKEQDDVKTYKASDILQARRGVDADMIVLAKRVINAVEGLPRDHREALLKSLE